jgi:hypothetical protein
MTKTISTIPNEPFWDDLLTRATSNSGVVIVSTLKGPGFHVCVINAVSKMTTPPGLR